MIKVGIVIQGPIISAGYDCTSNIDRLIENYSQHSMVEKIVLSTWVGENYKNKNEKLIILKNEPIIGCDFKNRLKQITSTYEGVKFLEYNSAVSHVLKIRTDQFLDVDVINFMETFYSKSNQQLKIGHIFENPLLFPYVSRTIPFHIGDYFFGGQINDISNFLKSNLSFGHDFFQGAAEVDMVLKHLYRMDPDFNIPFWILYKQMCIAGMFPRNHKIWEYWLTRYSTDFACFPKNLFDDLEWRGKIWDTAANERIFDGRAEIVRNNFYDFYAEWILLRTDRESYLNLPIEKQIGKVRYIWDWWQFIKKMAFIECRYGFQVLLRAYGKFKSFIDKAIKFIPKSIKYIIKALLQKVGLLEVFKKLKSNLFKFGKE